MSYRTPAKHLIKLFPILGKLESLYYSINKLDKNTNLKQKYPKLAKGTASELLGGFLPLFFMGKDIIDTFKPYKSGIAIIRDALQPLRGIGNIIRGIANIFIGLLFLPLAIGLAINKAVVEKQKPGAVVTNNITLLITCGTLLDGITSIARGIGQVITTPLTWLIRMPLRGIISAAKGGIHSKKLLNDTQEAATHLIPNEDSVCNQGSKLLTALQGQPTQNISNNKIELDQSQVNAAKDQVKTEVKKIKADAKETGKKMKQRIKQAGTKVKKSVSKHLSLGKKQ